MQENSEGPSVVKDKTNLGSVLVQMELVTMDKLKQAVIAQMDASGEQRLGAVLVAMGAITQDDLNTALEVQKALREGDSLTAHMSMISFQNRRIERSVDKSTVAVDRALEAWDKPTHA